MYYPLLMVHSWFRWLVLLSLAFAVYRAWRGWRSAKSFTKFDDRMRHITATIAHIQLVLGLWLYFISPLVDYFLHHFSEAVHHREQRFFGMEHITMMVIAIGLITAGSVIAKRKQSDKEKFKAIALWYGIALLIIFLSVPWAFSPFTARPYYRF